MKSSNMSEETEIAKSMREVKDNWERGMDIKSKKVRHRGKERIENRNRQSARERERD